MWDLHTHTFYSDGTDSPDEILERAALSGISGFSITDHNRLLPDRERVDLCAQQRGLRFVEGIEISCEFDLQGGKTYSIHMLGYSAWFDSRVINTALRQTIDGYRERGRRLVKKCNGLGIAIDYDALFAETHELYLSRNTVAQEICRLRNLEMAEALQIAFVEEKEDWFLRATEAIHTIHRAGGIAVWAHPGKLLKRGQRDFFDEMLGQFCSNGLDGIEVFHPSHPREIEHELVQVARQHKLLITGGSDFHGDARLPRVALGDYGVESNRLKNALANAISIHQPRLIA